MTVWRMFIGGKTIALALVALAMTLISLKPPLPILAQVRNPASVGELERRMERVEGINIEHRLTALEISAQQNNDRLQSIEMMVRIVLVGLASLVGETVWSAVLKWRKPS